MMTPKQVAALTARDFENGAVRDELYRLAQLAAAAPQMREALERDALERSGFVIGARDARLNRNYRGAFMVAEPYTDEDTPTNDGSNGPFCIVGDNLSALIHEAFAIHEDVLPLSEATRAALRAANGDEK